MGQQWKSVESVAKNDKGEYLALVDGAWTPVRGGAKNDAGQYMADFSPAEQTVNPSALDSIKRGISNAWDSATSKSAAQTIAQHGIKPDGIVRHALP